MDVEFAAITTVDMVEHYPGTGSTDFWGISFAFSSIDRQDLSSGELERELTLMQACWAFFDDVRGRVSAEMQKGPRGGGVIGITSSVIRCAWSKSGQRRSGAHSPRCDADRRGSASAARCL